jgi:hypothetical protein
MLIVLALAGQDKTPPRLPPLEKGPVPVQDPNAPAVTAFKEPEGNKMLLVASNERVILREKSFLKRYTIDTAGYSEIRVIAQLKPPGMGFGVGADTRFQLRIQALAPSNSNMVDVADVKDDRVGGSLIAGKTQTALVFAPKMVILVHVMSPIEDMTLNVDAYLVK